jgi:hypothetical protein
MGLRSAAKGRGRALRPLMPFMIVRLDPALDALLGPDARLDTNVIISGLNSEGPMWRDGSFANQRIFFDFSKSPSAGRLLVKVESTG